MSRHFNPDQAIAEMRGPDEMEDRDWTVGGPEGRDIRAKRGTATVSWSQVICDPRTPCWLCEPGYVCAFHRCDSCQGSGLYPNPTGVFYAPTEWLGCPDCEGTGRDPGPPEPTS